MTFGPGDRVQMRYGPGTVIRLEPDAASRGREPLVWVHADVGQAWLCTLGECKPLAEEQLRLEPDGFADWVEQLPDRGQAT